MSTPFTIEEALESARAHATTAAKLRSEADEIGAGGLLRLATEHERSGLTLRAYAVLHGAVERLTSKLAAANQRADEEHARLMRMIEDTVDGMECLPKCDSFGHEEMCPVANPVQAWRLLREQLAAAIALAEGGDAQ